VTSPLSLTIDWPTKPQHVAALSTTRRGGVSVPPYDDGSGQGGLNLGDHVADDSDAVKHNRERLRVQCPSEPVWLKQVHGTHVVNAAMVQGVPEADASFTTQAGVVCAILTADCLPVLFCDQRGSVVAAAHAGWRGLSLGVLENTVAAMRAAGAKDVMAWMGPAIGPQKFEVGADVVEAFAHLGAVADAAFLPIAERPGKFLANLPLLVKCILNKQDVTQLFGGENCTVSDAQRFYSFRRDGVTGRMASLIWIR
jgi:polyphenol oxidase